MVLNDLTSTAVYKAIAEFDELGRDEFLRRHGFGKAKRYFLKQNGKAYDSKAIAGVAHGYQSLSSTNLKPDDFHGGPPVKLHLERLGFTVDVDDEIMKQEP